MCCLPAIARVSGIVDTIVSTSEQSNHAAMEEVSKAAIEKAVGSGALRETVSIAEIDDIPLPVSYPTFGIWKFITHMF